MNRKGFTLVELLATLIVLGVIVSITVVSINSVFKNTKDKSEDVFVATIKDAMDMYLNSSQAKSLVFSEANKCKRMEGVNEVDVTLDKIHGKVRVYKREITFIDVINSEFKPITEDDLVNPSNEEECNAASSIIVDIYRDDDFVYYYSINKSSFGCLKNNGVITNLPWINVDYDINSDGVQDEKDGYFYQCG